MKRDPIEPKDPENLNQSLPKTGGFDETNGSLTSLGMILISLGGALIFFNKRKKKNSKNHI
ncbi:hypothetical protein CON03_06275 [Bacillus cereus]|uniref:LPXTG cell wall anchor domain-containing protein n=1 Tax=Bacillus mobilis TaxID=2026190 RepID=UPI000BECCE72|nr:hypothetical protein CON03_06275 [Bacillus cereus]PFO74192.1 hypothetical protein COJ86_08225 [Bacillus cereus]